VKDNEGPNIAFGNQRKVTFLADILLFFCLSIDRGQSHRFFDFSGEVWPIFRLYLVGGFVDAWFGRYGWDA
jgi:hypothetical protein